MEASFDNRGLRSVRKNIWTFPRAWGGLAFQACSTKVVHHFTTKPCSESSLKAANTWGYLRNQSLKVKEYIVQCRVRPLVLNCGTKWKTKIGERNFLRQTMMVKHSQLVHMRIRYHFIANLHITLHLKKRVWKKKVRSACKQTSSNRSISESK